MDPSGYSHRWTTPNQVESIGDSDDNRFSLDTLEARIAVHWKG